ncbi:VC0807 family protein [Nonomuraea sp. LP-02]|uniref:VC0807 family protein n=1 Tax=Nonomuraea sp. LP-02 TaxID=3097960 RepID=UPI002E2F2347|nr:VC0807 family protein [Nonomuraea sp. LP-02]MED7925391.1 VC0807 family protein [Nonomuraea sp. LP-02]
MRVKALAALVVDIALPMGVYYGLRYAGLDEHVALVLSSLVPALSVAVSLARGRRPDRLALFMTAMILAGAAVSALVHDPRFLLAKDGWFMGVAALWFLSSTRWDRPLAFTFTRFLLERRVGPARESWDVLWERLPAFRRIWRVVTVMYGVGLLADAAVRVVMAYTLPMDVVPALGTAQYVVWLLLMQVAINVYLVPSGLYNRYSPLYAPLREPAAANG